MPSMPSKASTGSSDPAVRCECGSLLARLTARGVEVKCRRCKRIILIPLDSITSESADRDKG
jgi:phage FluMu protein Com